MQRVDGSLKSRSKLGSTFAVTPIASRARPVARFKPMGSAPARLCASEHSGRRSALDFAVTNVGACQDGRTSRLRSKSTATANSFARYAPLRGGQVRFTAYLDLLAKRPIRRIRRSFSQKAIAKMATASYRAANKCAASAASVVSMLVCSGVSFFGTVSYAHNVPTV